MTLPSERSFAVLRAEEFLVSLLDPKKTPKVPLDIRVQAGRVLRHYPSAIDFAIGPKRFEWKKR